MESMKLTLQEEKIYDFVVRDGLDIVIDSRKAGPGSIFFGFVGESVDGNMYAKDALARGSGYCVVDNPSVVEDGRYIVVPDVRQTLVRIATYHRLLFSIPIIGITGSNGKTTTKELVTSVLRTTFSVLATEGNLNSDIGLPLMVLKLRDTYDMAVFEMGANHAGEIAILCDIAKPTHGIITNISGAHIGEFGSLEIIEETKVALYDSVSDSNGTVFVHQDDDMLLGHVERLGLDSISYSLAPTPSDYMLEVSVTEPGLCFSFESVKGDSPLFGSFNAINCACALAIGQFFGVSVTDCFRGISSYVPENNRSQFIHGDVNDVILDAYNANPASMKVALESFSKRNTEQKKVVILGDMFELGDYADESHREIGEYVFSLGFDEVFLVGGFFSRVFPGHDFVFENLDQLRSYLEQADCSNCLFFLKGSRGMALETLVDVFVD